MNADGEGAGNYIIKVNGDMQGLQSVNQWK